MSGEQIISLHRYFVSAVVMRDKFYELLEGDLKEYTPQKYAVVPVAALFDFSKSGIYLRHWYASLYVVAEGWMELGLKDNKIDELLKSDLLPKLKRYRNGSFHFQKKFFD